MKNAAHWFLVVISWLLLSDLQAAQPAQQPGYLGIIVDEASDDAAGIRVREVVRGGPCEVAGIRAGDQITAADGRELASIDDLRDVVQSSRSGTDIRFAIVRDGNRIERTVVPTDRPSQDNRPFRDFGRIPDTEGEPAAGSGAQPADSAAATPATDTPPPLLGVRTVAITQDAQRRLGLPSREGALVTSVVNESPAGRAGIPLEAVIFGVNRQPVVRPDQLAEYVRAAGAGATVEIDFFHDRRVQTRRITLSQDGRENGQALEQLPQPATGPPPAPENGEPVDDRPLLDRIDQLERVIADMAARLAAMEGQLEQLRNSAPPTDPPPTAELPSP